MNRNWIQLAIMGILVLAALTVSGCAVVGLFSTVQTYGEKEIWQLRTPSPRILDAIAETGRSMGLNIDYSEVKNPPPGFEYWQTKSPPPINKNDTRSAAILLSDNGLGGSKAILLGKASVSGLTFYAREEGKYLEVYVTVAGNFGSGKRKATANLLKDFRTSLSKRIGEIIVMQEAPVA